MLDDLFHKNNAHRALQSRGVIRLLHAKRANPSLPQLQGFSLAVACRLTPHQLEILDVIDVTNVLIAENGTNNFNWRAATMLNDNTAKTLFGRSVDALISSNRNSTAYSHR